MAITFVCRNFAFLTRGFNNFFADETTVLRGNLGFCLMPSYSALRHISDPGFHSDFCGGKSGLIAYFWISSSVLFGCARVGQIDKPKYEKNHF